MTFYNVSYFKFYRRQIKPIEMEKEFINLINSKNTNNYPLTERNNSQKEKKINLDIFFQKHSIDLIKKIVDLFIEFDIDKSNSFDRFEFFQMFNINKIPIKMDEIIYLFNFDTHKKTISFWELINLTFNPDFNARYREVITKIKPRLEIGIICPNNFSEMLSHLCEFGKLSSNSKRNIKLNSIKNRMKNIIKRNNNKYLYNQNKKIKKNNEEVDNNKKVNIEKYNIRHLSLNIEEESSKKLNNKKIYNRNKSKNIIESSTDSELFKKMNQFKKENRKMIDNYKTIIDITKKKIIRNEKIFKNMNYRNKYQISKRNLANSIDIIYKINPNINHTYISYNPLKQKFINLNTGNDYDFKNIINNFNNNKKKLNWKRKFVKSLTHTN